MSRKVVEAGSLKVGRYVMIDDEACRVVSIEKSKSGKHGHAKDRIVAVGLFDGVKRSIVTPSEALEFPLRLRIPKWCAQVKLAVNDEASSDAVPGDTFHELRHVWKAGDSVTLDMDMPWRLVRGRKTQEGRAALMRGPVVYCIGSASNADLLANCDKPGDLILDPASFGTPVADMSVRPDGLKVTAKAWMPGSATKDAPPLEVVLTEFVDPSCVTTYFRVSDLGKAVDDEW